VGVGGVRGSGSTRLGRCPVRAVPGGESRHGAQPHDAAPDGSASGAAIGVLEFGYDDLAARGPTHG